MSLEEELNNKSTQDINDENIIEVIIIRKNNMEFGSGFKKYDNGVRVFIRVTKNGEYSIEIIYESRKSYGIWRILEKMRIVRKPSYEFCKQYYKYKNLQKEITVETPKKAIRIAKKKFGIELPREYIIKFLY